MNNLKCHIIMLIISTLLIVSCKNKNIIHLESAVDEFEYLKKQTPTKFDEFEYLKTKFENLSYLKKHEIQISALYYLSEIALIQNKLNESYDFICQAYDVNHADSIYLQKQKIELLLKSAETTKDTLDINEYYAQEKETLNNIIEISRKEINILYENKNYDGAINQTNVLISIIKNLTPESEIQIELSQLYQDLAIFYSQKNNIIEAKKFIDKAVELNPNSKNIEIQKLIYKKP